VPEAADARINNNIITTIIMRIITMLKTYRHSS